MRAAGRSSKERSRRSSGSRRPRAGPRALTGTYLAAFVGLSLPIVGAGVALAEGVSTRVTLLAFAIAVGIGIVTSAIKLVSGPHGPTSRAAVAKAS